MTVASHSSTHPAAHTADLTAGRWRIPRTRGALGGFLLMLCGIWAALIPFVGPYFNFAYDPVRNLTPRTPSAGRGPRPA